MYLFYMGALTAKVHAFTFRTWEPKTVTEIDDTEVRPFNIRSEHLKVKRIRILPINYWMADKKRFSKEPSFFTNPSACFDNPRIFFLDYLLQETKHTQYIVSNIKCYNKILDKFKDISVKAINCFLAKRFPRSGISQLRIYNDLLVNRQKNIWPALGSFDTLLKNNHVILLANPRLESPAFNAFLYKNTDEYTFTSFSAFASNFIKEEIPLSTYTLNIALQGHYDLNSATIIKSCFTSLPNISLKHVITLTPMYLNTITPAYSKETEAALMFQFFLKPRKTFQPVFLSSNVIQGMTSLCLHQNSFDHFVLKKFSQKYLERLMMLYSLVKSVQTTAIFPLELLLENASSILFQPFKTI
jgi:hypothetical protein